MVRLVCVAVRVLMLSWEYPPIVVGGLGRHVAALATALAAQGHDVRVVTRGDRPAVETTAVDGVSVIRAAADPLDIGFTTESLLAWAMASEHSLIRAGLPELERWRPDVVHAHDWLVGQASTTLAAAAGAPLVTTVHATESGRHQGHLTQPLNRAIHSVERWLTRASEQVITCSPGMRAEVVRLFELPPERVSVAPNGVDARAWRMAPAQRATARARLGEGPLLVFAGRLTHEKGVQTLLDAMPTLRARHPGLRLVVAGEGLYGEALRVQARRLRIARSVAWSGFVEGAELVELFGAADVVVVPSLYEPFGLVALEAAAAGAPIVVALTGGLADLVTAGVPAGAFPPGDAAALADAVARVLEDPDAARAHAARARRSVRSRYSWPAIATQTAGIYRRACLSGEPDGP